MQKIVIDDIAQIAAEMVAYCSVTDNHAGAVGCYETIVELLNIILKNTEAKLIDSDLHEPNYEFYNDAYYIEYADNELWVGKMLVDKVYVTLDDNKVWVEGEYLDKYLKSNNAANVTVFHFDTTDNPDDIAQVPCFCIDKDKLGFTCCYIDDDGNMRFRYRGTEELTQKDAWDIVEKYCNE